MVACLVAGPLPLDFYLLWDPSAEIGPLGSHFSVGQGSTIIGTDICGRFCSGCRPLISQFRTVEYSVVKHVAREVFGVACDGESYCVNQLQSYSVAHVVGFVVVVGLYLSLQGNIQCRSIDGHCYCNCCS